MDIIYKLNDTHIDVPAVETQKLVSKKESKSVTSKDIQKRVQQARDIQTKRFKFTKIKSNSEMSTKDIKKYCPLSTECQTMMLSAAASLDLSARSYFKVIKIARTIADLNKDEKINTAHLAEALQYRPRSKENY